MKGQEVVRFVSYAGQRYRVLHASLAGAWLISYEEPGAPQYVAEADLERFDRVETSKRGKLLYNSILSEIDSMGYSISEQEKRQILMDILKKMC